MEGICAVRFSASLESDLTRRRLSKNTWAMESSAKRLARQIRFIVEVDRLKEIFRQTVLITSRCC